MLRVFAPIAFASVIAVFTGCGDSRPTEKKIVGAWSWTYIEGVGRMVFTADHKVKEGFPPEDKDGRHLPDDQFEYYESGTWRLEGDVLVTEMDNQLFIDMYDKLMGNRSDESSRRHRPVFKKEIQRQKIVKIDSKQMVFEKGALDRVRRKLPWHLTRR
jgi:hypothetical protein